MLFVRFIWVTLDDLLTKQEQQRVAVGSGNAYFISIRQGGPTQPRWGHAAQWPTRPHFYAAAAAAAAANLAVVRQFYDYKLIIRN